MMETIGLTDGPESAHIQRSLSLGRVLTWRETTEAWDSGTTHPSCASLFYPLWPMKGETRGLGYGLILAEADAEV